MKLFLTSAGFPPETTEAFLKLLGKKPEETKICLVITAIFDHHPDGKAPYLESDKQRLRELGFTDMMDIDLRNENEESLREKLKDFDVIIGEGGNTFYLLKYVKESGLDNVLREFLDRGGVYVGISAGSYVACPDISIADWKDPGHKNTVGLKDLRGLGLVDFYISPHYISEHEAIINENKDKVSHPIYALTDLQAIVINEGLIEFVGLGEFKKFE